MPNPSKILYSSPFPGIILGWFLALEAVVITIDPHAIQATAFALLWLYIEVQRVRDRRAKGDANPTAGLVEDVKGLGDLLKSVAAAKAQFDQGAKSVNEVRAGLGFGPLSPTPPEARPDGTAPKADRA